VLAKELYAKVKHIEITTSRLVNSVFAGEYHSIFKGKGMEFLEVRNYDPSDDMRDIDWNVTARMGSPFTKKFAEERELTVIFLVDVSASSYFGARSRKKSEVIAEICALLSFAAIKNNDRVGILFFSDHIEKYISPRKGKKHVLRVISEILQFKPKGVRTDLNEALRALNDIVRRHATVFLFSDFLTDDYEKLLKVSHKKHDVVAIIVADEREFRFPNLGLIRIKDAETGEEILFNSQARGFEKRYGKEAQVLKDKRHRLFDSIGMDYIEIKSHESYVDPLIQFFRARERKARY